MTLLLGAVGWSLFAIGALVHLRHFGRFRGLVSLHTRHAGVVALAVVLAELAVAVTIPIAYASEFEPLLVAASLLAALLGVGFSVWVARLVLTRSELPCACSFSTEPATPWSLLRSVATVAVVAFAFADHYGAATNLATILTGAALAAAVYTLPDALAWPAGSRALREQLST